MHTLATTRGALVAAATALLVALGWWALDPTSEATPSSAAAAAPSGQLGSLELVGLAGGTTLTIPVRSFDAGGTNTADVFGGGTGAGKFNPDPAAVVLKATPDVPLLLNAVATGRHLPEATVTVFRPGTNQPAQEWRFGDAVLTEVRQSGAGDATPKGSVALEYAEVELTTFTAGGSVAQSFCFDIVQVAPC